MKSFIFTEFLGGGKESGYFGPFVPIMPWY